MTQRIQPIPPTSDELRRNWYYWSHNKQQYYIVWRRQDDHVATARIRSLKTGTFSAEVYGPCWSAYQDLCEHTDLEEAKRWVQARVNAIIDMEFLPEYLPPLG